MKIMNMYLVCWTSRLENMFVFNLCVVLNHRKRIKYTFHAPLDTDNSLKVHVGIFCVHLFQN